jgi:hypothetical protein
VNRESHGFKPWEDVNDREPAEVTNLDRYGNPELPWSRARDALAAAASGPDITLGQVTKEKAERWTSWRVFAQVRPCSNIQLLPFSLVLSPEIVAAEPDCRCWSEGE